MSRLGKKLKNIKLKKYCAALMALVTVVSAIGSRQNDTGTC